MVRDKQDDRKHYFFVVNHIDSFLNYFSFMGFEVKCDKDNGVVMLDNCSEIGDKDKLQSNRYRFTCVVLSMVALCVENKRGNLVFSNCNWSV